MGLFSFVGSLLGGGSQKKAAQKAADAQVKAAQMAIDEQRRQYDVSRGDFMPFMQAGQQAIGGLSELIGLDGEAQQQTAIDALRGGPLYGSLYRNGEEALLQNGAATGGLRGGNMQRGLLDFGSDVLSNVYQNQVGNLSSVAGLGSGAIGSVAGLGQNAANQIGASLNQQGAARAGAAFTKGGINAQNWQNFGDLLDMKDLSSAAGSIFKSVGKIF